MMQHILHRCCQTAGQYLQRRSGRKETETLSEGSVATTACQVVWELNSASPGSSRAYRPRARSEILQQGRPGGKLGDVDVTQFGTPIVLFRRAHLRRRPSCGSNGRTARSPRNWQNQPCSENRSESRRRCAPGQKKYIARSCASAPTPARLQFAQQVREIRGKYPTGAGRGWVAPLC